MTNKKQARARERKRQEQLQRKIAERDARRRRVLRRVGIVAAAVVVVAAIAGIVAVFVHSRSPQTGATLGASPTPSSTRSGVEFSEGWATSPAPPDPSYADSRAWTAVIDTNQGPITVSLDGAAAPQAVASFIKLAGAGYFNQTDCHRLTTAGIYVLQCGDPTGTGTGGPAYRFGPIENAPADNMYPAGTIAMARQSGDGDSMGSQFFVVYKDSTIPADAAGGYTIMGTITDGLAIVDDVAKAGTITGQPDGRPAVSVIINEVTVS